MGPISKKSKKIKSTKIDLDNCPHPFNLSSLAFSPDSNELSRVCNICHYSWPEVCENNSRVVLRKETKDGPHVGRRYFQCTDRECNQRFFKWLDKSTRRYSTRQKYHFPTIDEVLRRPKFDADDIEVINSYSDKDEEKDKTYELPSEEPEDIDETPEEALEEADEQEEEEKTSPENKNDV